MTDDDEFAAWQRRVEERQAAFQKRLDALDERQVGLLQRLERNSESLGMLAAQTGQVIETLVQHQGDPRAHD